MLVSVRRAAALVAAPVLALGALAASATAPASAAPADPRPITAAAPWLAAQAPDWGPLAVGNTIDQAVALDAVGGYDTVVQSIGRGLREHLAAYTDYTYCKDWTKEPPCGGTGLVKGVSAGAVAKALVGLQAAGVEATDVDGVDVVAKLEDLLPGSGPLAGRAVSPETVDGAPAESGYTNVIGQAFAVRGLVAAESAEAPAATAYLTGLQCPDGSFREDLPAEGAAQSCTTSGAGSVDTTASAVLALDDAGAAGAAGAAAAADKAAAWLASVQQPAGGFASDGAATGANANATGLATQALGLRGLVPAARKGAAWVRAHQLVDLGACRPVAAADRGAIAYDDADLAAGLSNATRSTWLRATTQALPALQWAVPGTGAKVSGPAGFVRAGTKQAIAVTGAAPGEPLCVVAGTQKVLTAAGPAGTTRVSVTLPARSATTVVRLSTTNGAAGTAAVKALAAKRLAVASASKVRRGKTLRVVVRGLAARESVRVAVRGKAKAGKSSAKGVFVATLRVTGKPGKAKVTVRGQFADRTGAKTVRVVR